MAERHRGGGVMAVSHEVPLRAIITSVTNPETRDFWDLNVPPGSVTTLLAVEGRLVMKEMPIRP